jgi:hypothetical protein
MNLSNSNFPFGIEILGPQEVQFFQCYGTVKKIEETNELNILPVLNTGRFQVKSNEIVTAFFILNENGKIVHAGGRINKSEFFDLNLSSGIYFFKIISQFGNTYCEKFIIQP